MHEDVVAIDFESSYAKDRDISTLGVVPYLEHPDTEIYLVSMHGSRATYSGPIEDAPWAAIDGARWVSHNAAFDIACYLELIRRGRVDGSVLPVEWDCTANMAAYLHAKRDLAGAAMGLLGRKVDKGVRDAMKGKRWAEMSPEFRAQVIQYAAVDAEVCHQLWVEHSHRWPEFERALSRHTAEMCLRGIGVDRENVEKQLSVLNSLIWDCQQRIPWFGQTDDKGKEIPLLSPLALKAACVAAGIPPPLSTADKSELFEQWLENHGQEADFVLAVKEYRSLNRTREVLRKLVEQTRADGRLRYSLKYFGAHTGRWSGSAGLNFQNFSKTPILVDEAGKRTYDEGQAAMRIDMRGALIPGPGKKFIVADLSQIEARVALWFAEDWAQLDLIRSGLDLYEAHARSQMGYKDPRKLKEYCEVATDPKDRNIRQFAKCRVLGLGFGLGHVKFVSIVRQWARLVIETAEAKRIVDDYRARNPGIVKLWKKLDRAIRTHAARRVKDPFTIELPNGQVLYYFNVSGSDAIKACDEIGGTPLYFYGGKLFENVVQATARGLLGEAILRLEAAGYPVVLHAHDEVVCEVDPDVPVKAIADLMTVTPDWIEGLPIGCSAKEASRYFKD